MDKQAMFHLRNFSIKFYKKHKPNCDLLVLEFFPSLEIIQFWSVNYMCQVCILLFFEHFRMFGKYLYLSVFS